MQDVLDLYPLIDGDTAEMLDLAIHNLACLRGLTPRAHDPAVRLHLLASLYEQARTDLFETTLAAHQHGYSPTQIAVVLNLH